MTKHNTYDQGPLDVAHRVWPGMVLATGVTAVAIILAEVETAVIGHPILEPMVLSLLLGLVLRMAWTPPARALSGIAFSGKQVLELAIVVLGLTLNLRDIMDAGWKIIGSVLLLVPLTIIIGVVLGRAMGLDTRLAVLVATGNAIFGNSAIAAMAPAIRAKKSDVAAAISLTAVFGVGVVLGLPLLVPMLNLSDTRYGVIAGLSVYAVPQVLAATFTVSASAGQIASLVKLTRVMMLGPVVAIFALLYRNQPDDEGSVVSNSLSVTTFLPWFVIGFFVCAALRTAGLVPTSWQAPMTEISRILTAVAMAGLGMGVDIRHVREKGGRVVQVVVLLTVLLVATAWLITTALQIG